jgi:hypothetical protein
MEARTDAAASDRDVLVAKLVAGARLSTPERSALGAFVTRREVANAIALHLQKDRRFPRDLARQGGGQIVVVATGVRLVGHRLSAWRFQFFPTAAPAIERYIDSELGPSCGGVPLRGTGHASTVTAG